MTLEGWLFQETLAKTFYGFVWLWQCFGWCWISRCRQVGLINLCRPLNAILFIIVNYMPFLDYWIAHLTWKLSSDCNESILQQWLHWRDCFKVWPPTQATHLKQFQLAVTVVMYHPGKAWSCLFNRKQADQHNVVSVSSHNCVVPFFNHSGSRKFNESWIFNWS